MRIRSLLLCEAAYTHDSLLFILGGGINRIKAQGFPTLLDVFLAVAFEAGGSAPEEHEILAILRGPGRREIGRGGAKLTTTSSIGPTTIRGVTPVALPIRALVDRPGTYSVLVVLDGKRLGVLPLLVDYAPE